MKTILIMIVIALLAGCNLHLYHHNPDVVVQDTLIIRDTVSPCVIIIKDTIRPEVITLIDTFIPDIINPWPGFISHLDSWQGDSLKRVWLQWGENGPWHQYLLNDTCR